MNHARKWVYDHRLGCRIYRPEHVPEFNILSLPADVRITIPMDGGFWLIERATGIRYRRITMADLPKKVSWASGKGRRRDAEDEDCRAAA